MLADTRIAGREAFVQVLPSRLSVLELDELHADVLRTLQRSDISRVVLDLQSIDMIDTSLINVLRSLALRARKHASALRLSSVPEPLKHVLLAPSHRLRWAQGLLPNDETIATVGYSSHRRRRRRGWRHAA